MKIAVTGAGGQLGGELCRRLGDNAIPLDFPHFDLNLNTGAPEGAGGEMRVATNRVFVDKEHASHVVLPVIRRT